MWEYLKIHQLLQQMSIYAYEGFDHEYLDSHHRYMADIWQVYAIVTKTVMECKWNSDLACINVITSVVSLSEINTMVNMGRATSKGYYSVY